MWVQVLVLPSWFSAKKGRWVIEVADEFPKANVVGMDLAPIQPIDVPLNCEFRVGDMTKDLDDFVDGNVDLVHSREISQGL